MRRLAILLACAGVLPAVGCYHTGGKCDCYPPVQPCCIYGLYPPAYGWPVTPPPPTPAVVAPTTTQAGAEVPADPTPHTPMKEQIGLPREL